MNQWDDIAAAVAAATGAPFTVRAGQPVAGGCINQAYRLRGDGVDYFVKLNDANALDMFEAEAEGLAEMASADAIRVPRPVTTGVSGASSFIVMEHVDLGGRPDPARAGAQLAAMHRRCSDRFGWHRHNTIGSTPQINSQEEDWITFWRQHRLGFQLGLAARRGIGRRAESRGERLLTSFEPLFSGYQPQPSLLHGDLWGGNAGADAHGDPVIFDPATYYGDRETDLAMTELFGGFGNGFRQGYEAIWPLDGGYGMRKTFYNLYHILNHYNLFGGGYGAQAEAMIDSVLAELG